MKSWQIELYDPGTTEAREHFQFTTAGDALAFVEQHRSGVPADIIRVLAPIDADKRYLDRLQSLGAEPL